MALVDRIGWSVLTSGLFLILAAVVSEMSGTQANISSHPSPETGAGVRRDSMTSYDVVTSITEADTLEVWRVYDAVFGDRPDLDTWRSTTWDLHVARAGFRLARAHDDGRLVGFAYGFTGEHGQWWTDRVARVLAPEVAAEWLGGHFDLVSLGVLEESRQRGVGRTLLREVTRDLPQARWTLMTTADADDPARHLYASEGWQVIGPGLDQDQVFMGRRRTDLP